MYQVEASKYIVLRLSCITNIEGTNSSGSPPPRQIATQANLLQKLPNYSPLEHRIVISEARLEL